MTTTSARFGFAAALAICLPAFVIAAQPAKKDRVDVAVDRALEFLANMQDRDGAWSSTGQKSPAVTSLAVMAFLSAGHVPGEGPYQETVEKGLRWVLRQQNADGLFGTDTGMSMYHHGISTLLLAEVVGMTDAGTARELRPKLEKATRRILQAQRTGPGVYRGGWRYNPDSPDADLSVSGWQLLALRAARNAGCDVPAERIDLALDFVLRCREPRTGGFCYTPGGRVTAACTGTGVLALELAGKDRHHAREALQGGGYLLKNPPRWGGEYTTYTTYYGAQAMFQLGNNYWGFYRPQLHKALLDNQQRNGGWISTEYAGPNYATAMAVLALTVEYRLLPIYQRHEEPPEN
jgi:hypothetical protein